MLTVHCKKQSHFYSDVPTADKIKQEEKSNKKHVSGKSRSRNQAGKQADVGEKCTSCGFRSGNEPLYKCFMEVVAAVVIVDQEMNKMCRKKVRAQDLLNVISSLRVKLERVKPQVTFIEMEGAKYCEKMDDFKTGALLIQVYSLSLICWFQNLFFIISILF